MAFHETLARMASNPSLVAAPFAGGVWKIHVELPDGYPYKSPSIGFMNKIFHRTCLPVLLPPSRSRHTRLPPSPYPYRAVPIDLSKRIRSSFRKLSLTSLLSAANIDELSGSVCLDVINQTWSPMYDMLNIFEVFLPQLLRYPNAADPLNGEAASLLMRDAKAYDLKVKGALPISYT